MKLTLFTHARARPSERVLVDLTSRELTLPVGKRVPLRPKAADLIGVLAQARLIEDSPADGWVSAEEIGRAPAWTSSRTSSSLYAQIRREIKALNEAGACLIETQPRTLLRGPFRLRAVPRVSPADRAPLSRNPADHSRFTPATAAELYRWLESTEPVWRAGHLFDKRQGVLDELPEPADLDIAGPIVATTAHLNQARRLRELGRYKAAMLSIRAAITSSARETSTARRSYLEATCCLHRGWIEYRRSRLPAASRAVREGLHVLGTTTNFKVLGQLLSLRSLLLRHRRKFEDALQDLRQAAECWVIEADLYNLFSVYHNLGCLAADRAASERDETRQEALLREAVEYAKKSENYCRRYDVGQNSVVTKLLLASLNQRLHEFQAALDWAEKALSEASDKNNWDEAISAHRLRLRALMALGQESQAECLHAAFCARLPHSRMVKAAARAYTEARRPRPSRT